MKEFTVKCSSPIPVHWPHYLLSTDKGPGFLHSVFNPQNNPMWPGLLFSSLVEMMKLNLTEMVRTELGYEPKCWPPSPSP